ncbi:MAG: hypothetical protein EXR86_12430 [Gammaproteobacteria bacterium]|nr:hypothetical protein [Gammaproteobacteria bacterium]
MIMDGHNLFSSAQAVFSAGTTVVSTNIIDLLKVAQDVGLGEPLYVSVTVTTAFAGGTSVTFNLITDDNTGMTSTATVYNMGTIPVASLTLAAQFNILFPIALNIPMERYVGIGYLSTGTTTAGSVTAGIVRNAQKWTAFPSNYPTA